MGIDASGLTFAPLPDDEVATFVSDSRRAMVEGLVAVGEERSGVEARADEMHSKLLSDGRLNPHHRIGRVMAGGESVGHLWVARDDSGWYVWDVAIEPELQGRGFGRAAMELAEEMGRADGADAIRLSVLATNDIARGLYRSLGYEVVEPRSGPLIHMTKQLRPPTTRILRSEHAPKCE
jgi:ribosomal protein S18 acetylase RimI-like enzyme